jgi:hypothetical protein
LWRTSCQESERCMPHLHGEVIHKLFQTSEEKYKPVKRCIILWRFSGLSLALSLSLDRESLNAWSLNPKLHNWRPTLMPLDLNPKVEFNSSWKRTVNNVARVNANKSFRS